MEYVETETLNDRHRLALRYFDIPLEWLDTDGLGVYVLGPRDSRHLHRGDATAALDEIANYSADSDSALVAMAKHLSRNGYAYRVINTHGYKWIDAIFYLDPVATGTPWEYAHPALDSQLDQWLAWLWGDTYLLEIEERVTYTAPGRPALDRWLPVESGESAQLIATRRHRNGQSLCDLAEHYGIDLSAYATRESERA